MALEADGTVLSWGFNGQGQLGTGAPGPASAKPVPVTGPTGSGRLGGIAAISGGGEHNLAIDTKGGVWSWGDNTFAELGAGTSTGPQLCGATSRPAAPAPPGVLVPSPAPQAGDVDPIPCGPVPAKVVGPDGTGQLAGVVAVSGGDNHSVALGRDGTVWTWGSNDRGQLGAGSSAGPEQCQPYKRIAPAACSTKPVQAVGPGGKGRLTGVTAIGVGGKFTMALKSDGSLWAWGINWVGELGTSTYTGPERCTQENQVACSVTPVQVHGVGGAPTLTGVSTIAVGDRYTVAGLK